MSGTKCTYAHKKGSATTTVPNTMKAKFTAKLVKGEARIITAISAIDIEMNIRNRVNTLGHHFTLNFTPHCSHDLILKGPILSFFRLEKAVLPQAGQIVDDLILIFLLSCSTSWGRTSATASVCRRLVIR